MRSLTFAPLLLASASAASHGLPEIAISKRDKHNGGATNIYRRSIPAHIEKRQGTVSTNIFDVLSWSNGGAYYANITVGTPPQEQTVILDTGSSDLYFDASSAATCKTTGETACKGGTFDPSKSNTYHESAASPAFNTSFGDGSTAVGPYSTDNIGIGDVVISNVQFGVADEVNSTTGYSIGLMGVGYSYNEAVRDERNLYPNMPEVLKDAGVINSRLYSVFLNEVGDTSGTILFGGIDKSKYTGELATLDLLPADTQSDLIYQFITTVTAANVTVSGKTSSLWSGGSNNINAYGRNDASLPVLLDTGSTAWTIPANYYNEYIAPAFSYVQRDGTCQCKNANNNDHLSLQFGGKVTINVPSTQFIVPLINSTTNEQVKYNDGSDACLFLLQPASGDEGIAFQTLGDAILTSMYVVFDLDNGQVSVAQAATNGGSPNVVTVQAGSSGVASAVQGVNTAPPNSYSIAPQITAATNSYGVSTAASTIGTATGEAAVPADAQVSGESGGSGSGTGSGSSSSSSGAAAGLVMPGADYTGFWITSIWVALGALGAGIML